MSRIWDALKQAQRHRSERRPGSPEGTERRRSPRRPTSAPLLVYGSGSDKQPFHEEAEVIEASEHGCQFALDTRVARGQRLLLTNTRNQAEQECRVVYARRPNGGKSCVGVAFPAATPEFWRAL